MPKAMKVEAFTAVIESFLKIDYVVPTSPRASGWRSHRPLPRHNGATTSPGPEAGVATFLVIELIK